MDYITTKEASERLNLSDAHIRRLIKSGDIKAVKLGHDWLIEIKSLDYKRQRKPKRR